MTRRTSETLDLNSCKNYKVLHSGISNTSETLKLNVPRHRHSTSSFAYNPSRRDSDMVDQIEVSVSTLGEILSGKMLESPFLKVDTEGYEYNVFSGVLPDHGLSFDYIVFEYSGRSLKMAGVEPTRLLGIDMLSQYLFCLIHQDGSMTRREVKDISALKSDYFLLVKEDKVAGLEFLPS